MMKRLWLWLLLIFGLAAPSFAQSQSPQGVVCKIAAANMNITTDQPCNIPLGKWQVNKIVVTNASISLTLAVGGFYSASSKGGTVIVLAAQVYSALTTGTVILNPAITAAGSTTAFTGNQIFFSLTTAQGAAATADIYIFVDALP